MAARCGAGQSRAGAPTQERPLGVTQAREVLGGQLCGPRTQAHWDNRLPTDQSALGACHRSEPQCPVLWEGNEGSRGPWT